jgi:PncC family amidohydrolase
MNPEETLGSLLTARVWTVAVAESCTGGLLGSTITDVPGSSTYFLGGITAYSNSSKTEVLGVPLETLQKFGAVSERAAIGMAVGILNNFGCDFAIAITGIAGPTGGSEAKPVGTVFITTATEDGEQAKEFHFKGSRDKIKAASVKAALEMACEALAE